MTIDSPRSRVLRLSRALVPLCLLAPACGGAESPRVIDAATDVAPAFDVQPASTATSSATGTGGTATATGTGGTATGTATGTSGTSTGTETTVATGDFTVAQSQLTRDLSPTLAPGDQDAMVAAVNSLGFDLLANAALPDANASLSPYSISKALAMAWAGARGTSEEQMTRVLHFSLPQARLHPAFNALDLAITSPSALAGQFTLNLVNSVWAERTFTLLPSYLDTLALSYGAPVRLVDFVNAPEPARVTINQWVKQETAGLIPELLGPLDVSSDTRVVLTNAIHFKAKWSSPFGKNGTGPGAFHLADGTDITVDTMVQVSNWAYAAGTDFQAVELPYLGYDTSMIVVLPAAGKLAAVAQTLAAGGFASLCSSLVSSRVYLLLPKFHIDTRFGLGKTLVALGMDNPMCSNPAADYDFSGMSPEPGLCISDVIHQSNVLVDEAGTEAAAATGVVMGVDASASFGEAGRPIEMRVDRPFLFFIHNRATGAILFMGRVANPKP